MIFYQNEPPAKHTQPCFTTFNPPIIGVWLSDYKRPNDKLHELLSSKILATIKKGLYVARPALNAAKPEPFLIANHILGPSYVSMETALS